jgi:hypothetical protein
MNKCSFILFAVLFFSCQNLSEKNTHQPEHTNINKKIVDPNSPDSTSQLIHELISPPDIEEAETLIARYYSTRNQELKYPFYKGLGLKILEIKRITGTDSFLVFAKVNGRKWPNPNKDTVTLPFDENKSIRAFRNGPLWQADSVGNK